MSVLESVPDRAMKECDVSAPYRRAMLRLSAVLMISGLQLAAGESRDIRETMQGVEKFERRIQGLLVNHEVRVHWPSKGTVVVCRVNPQADGHRFLRVDLTSGAKAAAFDHEALAKALGAAAGREVSAGALPLDGPEFSEDHRRLRFRAFGKAWIYQAQDGGVVADPEPPPATPLLSPGELRRGTRENGPECSLVVENTRADEIEMFWVKDGGGRQSYGKVAAGKTHTIGTFAGHCWLFTDSRGRAIGGVRAAPGGTLARVGDPVADEPRPDRDASPDGKWRAAVRDHNLVLQPKGGGEAVPLTTDGTAAHGYHGPFHWSPDSRRLVAWRTREVDVRKIHIVQSSPPDQLQPKLQTLDYAKPGDPIRQTRPCLFDAVDKRRIPVDEGLFDNPWDNGDGAWSADSAEFSFVYNQRGHQVMRIVGIRGGDGRTRAIHEERSRTFIDYSQKTWFHRIEGTSQALWASESSGFNHIYRLDLAKGKVLNPVTRGEWNVVEVVRVDGDRKRLLLKINGQPGSDPYHEHFAWVDFDGGNFTRLTDGDGAHRIEFSPDGGWLVDRWSRVDLPPVVELRRADNGRRVAEIARGDDSALSRLGWQRPERFVAKGRDGRTDIYGVIFRPPGFDPARRYPVLEQIYAGPHDYFVPKAFGVRSMPTSFAGLGFVVVQIDGMGTNWRSKAFHDVCWKNLADSGFPDRIAWLKAAAATRPWMDLRRMGIYGGSAGGQSALGALLHHGDFYQAAVADCGCHDNRMDKIWWNEAWMGWPVDESYVRSSNVTHAAKLRGKLMLVVGELDHNVDPASTMQVVGALQKAGIDFDFVPIVNGGHGSAESPYGRFRRASFLIEHLRPEPVSLAGGR